MNAGKLTTKQLAIIDGLLTGKIKQEKLFKKYKVKKSIYYKWLNEPAFKQAFTRRIEWTKFQSQLLILRYISVAAAKLIALTESKSEETARKACLDILSLPMSFAENKGDKENDLPQEEDEEISQATAEKLLEALACEEKKEPEKETIESI